MTNWDNRFIKITNQIAAWSSCMRRQVGAILVKDKRIIATGYNGAPQNMTSCVELENCIRHNAASGDNLNFCRGVHAEQNAIAQAAKLGISTQGAILYCTHKPCATCVKLLINSGITRIVYWNDYSDKLADKLLKESNLQVDFIDINLNIKENIKAFKSLWGILHND